MSRISSRVSRCVLCAVVATLFSLGVCAQPPFGGPDERSARERALIDITGQWVSIVTEDWLWRMVTPPPGDTASVPLNAAGRELALSWDRDRDVANDRLCLAFGPPGLIRQPGRIRISWEDDDTLRLDFDAGMQTRLLRFAPGVAPAPPSLQGLSAASWFRESPALGLFGPVGTATAGALHVRTTQMTPGYLRPNGVPYSDQAVVKEYFNTFSLPGDGGAWLIVTMVVDDPVYLTTEFITSTHFRKEAGQAGWSPRPCEIAPPAIDESLYTPGPFG